MMRLEDVLHHGEPDALFLAGGERDALDVGR
jgi:hypothetical protein